MTQVATINPLNQFFDQPSGLPLTNGKIYIGEKNKDPEQFPITVYWDAAGLVPAIQPIRTTSGYPTRNGSPAILYVNSLYSMRVRNQGDVQVFYIQSAGTPPPVTPTPFIDTGLIPSFATANTFTVTGDQTSIFLPGGLAKSRVRMTLGSGFVYGTVINAVYGALTTVTLTMDSTPLDASLSAVATSFLQPSPNAIPLLFAAQGNNTDLTSINILPGYLFGCTLSTAGASTTMSISAGRVTDSTGLQSMALTAIAKTTAAWALGTATGGLDTGATANNTTYHFYVIRRPDTGVVDVIFSLSATSPTLPANYTQFRRIGSRKTNGSAQWRGFIQYGDEVWLTSPVLEINSSAFVAASTLYTIDSIPTGRQLKGNFTLFKVQPSTGMVNFWDPALGILGASVSVTPLGKSYSDSATGATINTFDTFTDTSARIYGGASAGSQDVKLVCNGWTDTRGREE